jgi:hypothetical protein
MMQPMLPEGERKLERWTVGTAVTLCVLESVWSVVVVGVVAATVAGRVAVTVLVALEPQPAMTVVRTTTTSGRFTGLRLSRR